MIFSLKVKYNVFRKTTKLIRIGDLKHLHSTVLFVCLYHIFTLLFITDKNGNVPPIPPEQEAQGRPEKRGCCGRCLSTCGLIAIVIMVATIGGVLLYNNYTPFEVYTNKVVGDWTYPVLRTWRHIVLPLHNYFDIEAYSMAECLISNPWFVPGN